MEDEYAELLAKQIYNSFNDELAEGQVFIEGLVSSFLLSTEAGMLAFNIELYLEDGELSGAVVDVHFMLNDRPIHPYDLCNITLEGYEVLNRLQSEVVWSKLYLYVDEHSKLPKLNRVELFNEDYSDESCIEQLVKMLGLMRNEGVQVLPLIAALYCGEHINLPDVPDALRVTVGALQ